VLVEGAVGHQHMEVDVQLQRRAEALHGGRAFAPSATSGGTSTAPTAAPPASGTRSFRDATA
jgi:hypothetical protein